MKGCSPFEWQIASDWVPDIDNRRRATARHCSTWMVVMKTNVDIHISAIGRYEDELIKRDGEWLILRRVRIE